MTQVVLFESRSENLGYIALRYRDKFAQKAEIGLYNLIFLTNSFKDFKLKNSSKSLNNFLNF